MLFGDYFLITTQRKDKVSFRVVSIKDISFTFIDLFLSLLLFYADLIVSFSASVLRITSKGIRYICLNIN